MSKKLPIFKTDREAEDFLEQNLSDYISADNFAPFQFEYRPKQKSINREFPKNPLPPRNK